MRILFSCHGAYGHFHLIAPMALAAQAKGHDVAVATGPDLVDWVAACGLRAAPVGLSSGELRARLAALPEEDHAVAMFHRFSTIAVPPTLTDLQVLTRSWSPDVVVHEEGEYGAPLFAALRQIPCVTQSWAAPARPAKERQLYRTLLAPIWAAQGLHSAAYVTFGTVSAFSRPEILRGAVEATRRWSRPWC